MISDKIEFLWDISRQKYVSLMKDTQDVMVVEKEHIKKWYHDQDPADFKNIKDSLFLKLPSRFLEFHPDKEEKWYQNTYEYQNTYIKSKIQKSSIEYKESKGLLALESDFSFLKKYPHIEALFKNILPDGEELDYFLNWLSYIFNTNSKARTAILIKGAQGTGKGVLFDQIIEYYVGKNYCLTLSNDDLNNNFTPKRLDTSLFVLGNEIKGDFRDGNTVYEKLKMYITDPTIRIEEKGVQSRTVNSYFNMLFFSNNSVPLQIQGSDRRYSIFETETRKLDEVANDDFGLTIEKFIKEIKKERDNFLRDLICYKYSKERATVPLETEAKERIYRASMTKIEILVDKIKKLDKNFFVNDFAELLESYEYDELLTLSNKYQIMQNPNLTKMAEVLFKSIYDDIFKGSRINNKTLIFLYKIFVSSVDNNTKMGTSLNSHFGSSTVSNGLRYRKIKEFENEKYKDKYLDMGMCPF